jgi:hypothetical protein
MTLIENKAPRDKKLDKVHEQIIASFVVFLI